MSDDSDRWPAVADTMARFYDLDHDAVTDDIDFYVNMARRTGSPLLELGVGTGRVAIPLVKAGFEVVGVDSSAAMLARAEAKAVAAGASGLRLVRADVRDLDLERRFALAFSALGSFMHFLTPSDQMRALLAGYRHLKVGGLLVVDLPKPELEAWGQAHGELLHEWTQPEPSGGFISKLSSYYLEPPRQWQHVTHFYDRVALSGEVRRTVVSFALRYCFPFEMELLLERCGYTLEAVYGSYDLDSFGEDSQRMIFVARRPS